MVFSSFPNSSPHDRDHRTIPVPPVRIAWQSKSASDVLSSVDQSCVMRIHDGLAELDGLEPDVPENNRTIPSPAVRDSDTHDSSIDYTI